MSIAETPKPPYYAAIFSYFRAPGDDAAYNAFGDRMAVLAMAQPGFLGFEFGADTPEHFGLFVSYWRTDHDIIAWKRVGEHHEAQRKGYEEWFQSYKIRISKVERDYSRAESSFGTPRALHSKTSDG
jgi:heme-degrading monooxygenase HmoA